MTRTEKMNAELDRHFKSNKGNWFVTEDAESNNYVTLWFHAIWKTKLSVVWVALHILRKFKDVEFVKYGGWVFSKASLRRAGFKI